MNSSDSVDLYIATLKEKYLAAVRDEQAATELLRDAQRRKEVYALTLKEEKEQVPATEALNGVEFEGDRVQSLFAAGAGAQTNGHKITPLNATHALHLIMLKHDNKGFTFAELKRYSDELGYGLTEDVIKKVFWRQMTKGLTERIAGSGKVRLTEKGMKFDRFRVAKMN